MGDFERIAVAGFDIGRERLTLCREDGKGGVTGAVVGNRCLFKDYVEAHFEAEARRGDEAAFCNDDWLVFVQVLGRDVIESACWAEDGLGVDGLWHTKEVLDEVGIVDMEVHQSAAALVFIGQPVLPAPGWGGGQTSE